MTNYRHRSWCRMIALMTGLVFVAAACGGSDDSASTTETTETASKPTKGGELVFGAESDISTLDVGAAAQPADKVVTLGLYDPLMTYEDGELVPFLATSLEAGDGGKDLSTYTLTLPTDVTFQDGTPLNAEAVKKHFERLQDPTTACPCLDTVKQITNMELPNGPTGDTVIFTLASPDVAFGDTLAGSVGYIESPAAVAKYGDEYKNNPVGTGPFKLAEFVPGDRVVLVANPDYWGKDENGIQLPYLDKFTVKPIPDSGQRVSALESGDIDLFQTADTPTVKAAEAKGFSAQKISGSSSTILLMNNAKPPFNDVRARQAVAYCTNKDLINERVYEGIRQPSYSGFATDSAYYNADAGTPRFDLKKCQDLVKELGGLKFSIVCIPTPEADNVLQLVKQMGEAGGMEITLETQDQGAFVARMFARGGDYEGACFRSGQFQDPDAIRAGLTTDDAGNLTFYSNKEVDKLLKEGQATADFDKRKAAYDKVQEITGEEVPLITTLYDLFGNVYNSEKVGGLPPGEVNSLGAIKPGYIFVASSK
ncbi:MAG: hypothetical protein EXQ71_04110 [Acidimicrobiia bacterium]|nr:hypothetical protein [Acidimicrobiia bacterium]